MELYTPLLCAAATRFDEMVAFSTTVEFFKTSRALDVVSFFFVLLNLVIMSFYGLILYAIPKYVSYEFLHLDFYSLSVART